MRKVKTEAKVILLNGVPESGKDTFVDMCKKVSHSFNTDDLIVFIDSLSTVDIPKKVMSMIGWNSNKDERSRRAISDMKLFIENYNDGIFKYITQSIEQMERDYKKFKSIIIFVMCREAKNIDRYKSYYKGRAVSLLIKPNEIFRTDYGNIADNQVYDYKYDYEITNIKESGLEDLKVSAANFIDEIIKK